MWRKRNLLVFSILICLGILAPVQGQSKKTIREKGISSVTVHEYFLGEGMDQPVVESVERFTADGDLAEIKETNKRGKVTRWERYAYDDEGKLVGEFFLNEKGDTIRRETTVYDGALRVEKQFYDSRGRLFKRKEYLYEYRR